MSTETLQSVVTNVNWELDTDVESQDPILLAAGAEYLVQETDEAGTVRWYDPFTHIYESTTNDDDIKACMTEGDYLDGTVMAVIRDLRYTNLGYPSRWVIHICKSAMTEKAYTGGFFPPQLTIDLLYANRTMVSEGPILRQNVQNTRLTEFHIGMFRYIDYTLLQALLYIRQVEEGVLFASDSLSTIFGDSPWDYCLTNKNTSVGKSPMAPLFGRFFLDLG